MSAAEFFEGPKDGDREDVTPHQTVYVERHPRPVRWAEVPDGQYIPSAETAPFVDHVYVRRGLSFLYAGPR